MKKEFWTLLQFILIVGLAAVFFSLIIPLKYPELSIEAMEDTISELRYWIYSFMGLGVIRFGLFYVIFRKVLADTNNSLMKVFLNELSKSFQYFIIAVFSTFGAFWLLYFSFSRFSPEPVSLWFGVWYSSFIWLPAFTVLSLLRLGIVCLINKNSQKSI